MANENRDPCRKLETMSGWRCTRDAGHPGPCGGLHESMDLQPIDQRAGQLRDVAQQVVSAYRMRFGLVTGGLAGPIDAEIEAMERRLR